MSDASIIVPGATYFGPSNTIDTTNYKKTSLEGQPHILPDQDLSFVLRSGAKVYAVAARNVSGITLMPGLAVRWQAAYRFRRFDGYSDTLGGAVGGIIDPNLTAGVRHGDICLIYVHGPCLVRVPLTAAGFNSSGSGVAWVKGGTIVDGDILMAQTGVLTGNTVSGTTADGGGHLCAWNATGGMTCTLTESTSVGPSMIINKVGRVMSALTTAETTQSQRVLVSLEWLPMP